MESNGEGNWTSKRVWALMPRIRVILANKVHMTQETKELLDSTGRFLIEKRGTTHIKVGLVICNSIPQHLSPSLGQRRYGASFNALLVELFHIFFLDHILVAGRIRIQTWLFRKELLVRPTKWVTQMFRCVTLLTSQRALLTMPLLFGACSSQLTSDTFLSRFSETSAHPSERDLLSQCHVHG